MKNLAKKQNVQQSSENEQPNRNSKQNTTDRAAVIDKRKGKSTHHSSEPEILPKKQKVQELSENKKLKRNPEKNTTDTATVNNETKRKLSHSSNELESFPKKQKLQLSESEKLILMIGLQTTLMIKERDKKRKKNTFQSSSLTTFPAVNEDKCQNIDTMKTLKEIFQEEKGEVMLNYQNVKT